MATLRTAPSTNSETWLALRKGSGRCVAALLGGRKTSILGEGIPNDFGANEQGGAEERASQN